MINGTPEINRLYITLHLFHTLINKIPVKTLIKILLRKKKCDNVSKTPNCIFIVVLNISKSGNHVLISLVKRFALPGHVKINSSDATEITN